MLWIRVVLFTVEEKWSYSKLSFTTEILDYKVQIIILCFFLLFNKTYIVVTNFN